MAANKKPAKKKRNQPEYDLQVSCVEWLHSTHPELIVFSVPNEATYSAKTKYKKSGMLSGAPDLVLVMPKEVVMVELKSPVGKLSPEQTLVHAHLRTLNKTVYLCRSLEAFQAIVKTHL